MFLRELPAVPYEICEYNQPEMDDARIKRRAASIGENTAETIDRIFRSVSIKKFLRHFNPTKEIFMNYSDSIKTILLATINELFQNPEKYAVKPGVDFTRNRKRD